MAELKVTITDETGGETSSNVKTTSESVPTPTQNANKTANVNTKAAKETKANSQGLAIASMIGSRAFNYTTSNVGKWTGNSQNQQMVNNAMQVGSIAAMAYTSPYVAMAVVAIQLGTTAIDNAYEQKWDNARAERNQKKAGVLLGRRH